MKKKSQSYVSHTTIQEANNELKLEKRNTDFESSTGLARITPSTCGNTISCQNQSLCTIWTTGGIISYTRAIGSLTLDVIWPEKSVYKWWKSFNLQAAFVGLN